MSAYLLGLGVALVIYGPVSDRIGRKPVIIFGCVLLIAASVGCIVSRSLPELLFFRALQGAGASGPGMGAFTMVRDLFDGAAARAKMSYVLFAVNIVPMIAPTVGAALLVLGGWQFIYLVPIAGGCVLLLAMWAMPETARIDPAMRLNPASILRTYLHVLANPVSLGNILCNAGAAGAVFAYITGSSLFFINLLDLSPTEYGLIFGASSVAVMGGTVINVRLSRWGTSPGQLITLGLVIATLLAGSLLAMALAGGKSIALVMAVMVGVALSFGLISPNAASGALQPMSEIAGSASAVLEFFQMAATATSSGLVSKLFDGHSAFSMGAVMMGFCLLAIASYVGIARPAERSALIT